MKILVSGASGMIGSALLPLLSSLGHEVVRIVRKNPNGSDVFWDSKSGSLTPSDLSAFDAVIHLAGEPISKRWTEDQKQEIRRSRVAATSAIAQAIAQSARPPSCFISASAIGIYGDRGEELLDEDSPLGEGFLAAVGEEWESAAKTAASERTRVVNTRFGVVWSKKGGALAKILPIFKFGLGGRLGDGSQYWSWISLDDVVGALAHILNSSTISGPVNVVAPNPVTNLEFTRTLAKVLQRPAWFPVPAFAARAIAGPMVDELLFFSARVYPKRLIESGFEFHYPTLEEALRRALEE
ncbi:MAG: TIGR01777 family oxidoreductase [Fimbriimonadales bacterium]|nr:TIGR01777 family oxidoreductase [Fimbriimonadales bacterium]